MRTAAIVSCIALSAAAAPAKAQSEPDGLLLQIIEGVGQYIVQAAIVAARSQVEITYEDLIVDARTGYLALSGVEVRPAPPWDFEGSCTVNIDRLETSSETVGGYGVARIDLLGVEAGAACLPPEQGEMAASFGYETLRADAVSIEYDYDVGPSALNLTIQTALENAVEVEAALAFSYFWFETPPESLEGEEPPAPVMDLAFAEIVLSDAGALERFAPMIEATIGSTAAAPAMAEGAILQMLADGGGAVGPDGTRLAAEARAAVEAFLTGDGDIVVTVAPPEPVRVDPSAFMGPADVIAALSPTISSDISAKGALVPASLLSAALSGDELSAEERLTVGRALLEGEGAPASPEGARAALAPLVEAWNGEAALLSAKSRMSNPEEAYDDALRAGAGGAAGAAALLDRLERSLSVEVIIAAQEALSAAWPDAAAREAAAAEAIAAGDAGALGDLAADSADGGGALRDYATAYRLASLAAAAGDRGAAAVRDRIDRRLARRGGADAEAWASVRSEAAAQALEDWLGGFADRVAKP